MILRITDGTDSVNLLNEFGIMLKDWTPIRPLKKQGGIWRNSPIADNSNLVMRNYDNITDVLTLTINGGNMDYTIAESRRLTALLEKAEQYWTTSWQREPVWIERQGSCETDIGYAIIRSYQWEKDDNPFESPFSNTSLMDDIDIAIQHGFWQAQQPGTTKCVEISGGGYYSTHYSDIESPDVEADNLQTDYAYTEFSLGSNQYDISRDIFHATTNYYARFPDIDIPPGSTINNAYFTFVSAADEDSTHGGMNFLFYNIGDAPQLTAGQFATAVATPSAWINAGAQTYYEWENGVSYISPNMSNYVQQIVDRSDWASGNAIGVRFYGSKWTNLPITIIPQDWDELSYLEIIATNSDGSFVVIGEEYGRVYRSVDYANNFIEVQPAGNVSRSWSDVDVDSDGSNIIICSTGTNGRLYTSGNSGGTWTERQPAGNTDKNWKKVASDDDGSVLVACVYGGRLYISDSSGGAWTERQPNGNVDMNWMGVDCSADGSLIAVVDLDTGLYISTDTGATWNSYDYTNTNAGIFPGTAYDVSVAPDGSFVAVMGSYGSGHVFKSSSPYTLWERVTFGHSYARDINIDSEGVIEALTADRHYAKYLNKETYSTSTTLYRFATAWDGLKKRIYWISKDNYPIMYVENAYRCGRRIYGAPDANAIKLTVIYSPPATLYGRGATCDNEVYLANKSCASQIDNIFVYDSSAASYSENFADNITFELLPPSIGVGDMLYIGIQGEDLKPFSSVIFDINADVTSVSSYTWEYYNGASWVSFLEIDHYDETFGLSIAGVHSLGFNVPTNWAVTTINTIEGTWIRYRVLGIDSNTPVPSQQNRYIYTVSWPHVKIAENFIKGDYSARAAIQVNPASISNDVGIYSRNATKFFITTRSVDRGELFTPYLNYYGLENNNSGISFGYDRGEVHIGTVDSGCGNAWGLSDTHLGGFSFFTISESLSRQYIGKFHVLLRAKYEAVGTPCDCNIEIIARAGGINFYKPDIFSGQLSTEWQVIDFGIMDTDVASLRHGDASITIETSLSQDSTGCQKIILSDLILLPTDEIYYEIEDSSYTEGTQMAIHTNVGGYLFVDNTLESRYNSVALYKEYEEPIETRGIGDASLLTIYNRQYEYQSKKEQYIFVFGCLYDGVYLSSPHMIMRIRTDCVERYIGMIGNE